MSKPDYKHNDPKGWCGDPKRGAALGRSTIHKEPREYNGKIYVRKIKLSDGYDSNGTYFGMGRPLYWYANEDHTIDAMLRANNRLEAIKEIRKDYPNAKFFNTTRK